MREQWGQNYVKLASLTAWAYCSRMDGIAEPQEIADNPAQITPEQPLTGNQRMRKHWFTKENAKEMSDKAHKLKQERLDKLRQAAEPTSADDATYRLFRLTRTREQLLALDKQLEACSDPKLVKSLADAIARLCDVEQKLAMRPLPGSRRPGREPISKAPSTFEPSE